MGDDTVKIPTAFLWPAANADRKAESAFHVAFQWHGLPLLYEGTDYRIVDKSNAIPTIEILAAPASNAFWRLQGEALAGKIRLGHTPLPTTPPPAPFETWGMFRSLGNAVAGILESAQFAIRGMLEPRWTVTGDGPWRYAKEGTFNSAYWNGPQILDTIEGPLVAVDGKFSGAPCGSLARNGTTLRQRIALGSSATDAHYVYRAKDPDQRILYDEGTGQYYLESISGAFITHVDVDVYRREDVQLRTPLNAPHFVNPDPAHLRADQLSPFTRGIFDKARQLPIPEADQLQWAARQLAASWQYDWTPALAMLRISTMPESTYAQLHQPDGVKKAHCLIAATEFFHAARAYGYNVRLAQGQLDIRSVVSHIWVEFGDVHGIHVIEATPHDDTHTPDGDRAENVPTPTATGSDDHISEEWRHTRELLGLAPDYVGKVATLTSVQPLLQAMHHPTESIPQRATVQPKLRQIFEDLAPYVDHPDKTLALKPYEALRVASARWAEAVVSDRLQHQISYRHETAAITTLMEGLPSIDQYQHYSPLLHLMAFFNAARAYGYPVTLEVLIVGPRFFMDVNTLGKDDRITLFNDQFHDNFYVGERYNPLSGQSPISDELQRMAWMDSHDRGVQTFLTTMNEQLPKADAETFAAFAKNASAIPPILKAYRVNAPWVAQFYSQQDPAVVSSDYTLPDPPSNRAPEGDATALPLQRRHFVGPQDSAIDVSPPKTAAGKVMTAEELAGTAFQYISGEGMYYSSNLDLWVTGYSMTRLIMKNSRGQWVSFQWQFPFGAAHNRLLPVLRSDLTEGKQEVGEHTNDPSVSYDALSPLLFRLIDGIRKEGGLRPPRTDAERQQIVTLYHLILKMGVVRPFNCRDSELSYNDEVKQLVAMLYVMVEYQKLWEQNKGAIPETWMATDCTPVVMDDIPTGKTVCLPASAQSPDAGIHREWMRELAAQLVAAEDYGWPADIQNVIRASRKWR